MAIARNTIGATIGHSARNVAVGEGIIMGVGSGGGGDDSKFDLMLRLVYETRADVAVLRAWLVALTIALAVIGVLIVGWGIF